MHKRWSCLAIVIAGAMKERTLDRLSSSTPLLGETSTEVKMLLHETAKIRISTLDVVTRAEAALEIHAPAVKSHEIKAWEE